MMDYTKEYRGLKLRDFLLSKTKVGDFVDASDSGYNAVSCNIDYEDLFIRYIDAEFLSYQIASARMEVLQVTHEDGSHEEWRCWYIDAVCRLAEEGE